MVYYLKYVVHIISKQAESAAELDLFKSRKKRRTYCIRSMSAVAELAKDQLQVP